MSANIIKRTCQITGNNFFPFIQTPMKYVISRTSCSSNAKPHPDAKKCKVWRIHQRTCTEKYYNYTFAATEGGEWKSIGKNHKITECGDIYREEQTEKWTIEIKNGARGLIDFCNKNGGYLVFSTNDYIKICEIEIYDDYRE